MKDEATLVEEWNLNGIEVEINEALSSIQTDFPSLRFEWVVVPDDPGDITRRDPLRDLSVVDVVVTVVVTEAAKRAVETAYEMLRERLRSSRSKVKKRTKKTQRSNRKN